MIKFFRKIRQNLLSDGKTGVYLKYAVGEIVLVVIGILIALQINTIKNEVGDRKTEKMILEKLSTDLEKDIKDIDRLIQEKSNQVQACEYMIKFFIDTDHTEKNSEIFAFNLILPFFFYEHYPNNVVFDMAKSSGDLFKVSNDGLVDSLATYFSFTNLVQYTDETKKYTSDYLLILSRKYRVPFKQFHQYFGSNNIYTNSVGTEFPKKEFFIDFEMENYYGTMRLRLNAGINLAKKKKEQAAGLLESIHNKLRKL